MGVAFISVFALVLLFLGFEMLLVLGVPGLLIKELYFTRLPDIAIGQRILGGVNHSTLLANPVLSLRRRDHGARAYRASPDDDGEGLSRPSSRRDGLFHHRGLRRLRLGPPVRRRPPSQRWGGSCIRSCARRVTVRRSRSG